MRAAGGWAPRLLCTLAAVVAVAGCAAATTGLYTGNPLHDLIGIDQLVAPDFTVSSPAAAVQAAALAGGDADVATALHHDGLQAAASVEFQRADEFATANGPLDVVATVERFAGIAGATSAYEAGIARLDALAGATPTSTGPLGDQAHAVSIVKAAPGGLSAVEITVEWRVGNLVNLIVARGRYGGTRLDDVLVLAGEQTANETGSGSA
jgi:hypothetical protein